MTQVLFVTPVSILVTIITVGLSEVAISQFKNQQIPQFTNLKEFWFVHYISITGRILLVREQLNDIHNIGYSALGSALATNIAQTIIFLRVLSRNHKKPTCQQALDTICGRILRHSLESVFWSIALVCPIGGGSFIESIYVAILSILGFLLSFFMSVPMWHFFMKLKSGLNVYLPGDSRVEFSTAYDTFNSSIDDYESTDENWIKPKMTRDI